MAKELTGRDIFTKQFPKKPLHNDTIAGVKPPLVPEPSSTLNKVQAQYAGLFDSAKHISLPVDTRLPWQLESGGMLYESKLAKLKGKINWLRYMLHLKPLGKPFEWKVYELGETTSQTIQNEYMGKTDNLITQNAPEFFRPVQEKLVSLELKLRMIEDESLFKKRFKKWMVGRGNAHEYLPCYWVKKDIVEKFINSDGTQYEGEFNDEARKIVRNTPSITDHFVTSTDLVTFRVKTFLEHLSKKIPKTEEEAFLFYKYIVLQLPLDTTYTATATEPAPKPKTDEELIEEAAVKGTPRENEKPYWLQDDNIEERLKRAQEKKQARKKAASPEAPKSPPGSPAPVADSDDMPEMTEVLAEFEAMKLSNPQVSSPIAAAPPPFENHKGTPPGTGHNREPSEQLPTKLRSPFNEPVQYEVDGSPVDSLGGLDLTNNKSIEMEDQEIQPLLLDPENELVPSPAKTMKREKMKTPKKLKFIPGSTSDAFVTPANVTKRSHVYYSQDPPTPPTTKLNPNDYEQIYRQAMKQSGRTLTQHVPTPSPPKQKQYMDYPNLLVAEAMLNKPPAGLPRVASLPRVDTPEKARTSRDEQLKMTKRVEDTKKKSTKKQPPPTQAQVRAQFVEQRNSQLRNMANFQEFDKLRNLKKDANLVLRSQYNNKSAKTTIAKQITKEQDIELKELFDYFKKHRPQKKDDIDIYAALKHHFKL